MNSVGKCALQSSKRESVKRRPHTRSLFVHFAPIKTCIITRPRDEVIHDKEGLGGLCIVLVDSA